MAREKHQGTTTPTDVVIQIEPSHVTEASSSRSLAVTPRPESSVSSPRTDLVIRPKYPRTARVGVVVQPVTHSWPLGAPSLAQPPMFPGGSLAALAGASPVTGELYDYIVHQPSFPRGTQVHGRLGFGSTQQGFTLDSFILERDCLCRFFFPLLTAVDRHLIFIPASIATSIIPFRLPSEHASASLLNATSSSLSDPVAYRFTNIRPDKHAPLTNMRRCERSPLHITS